MNKIFNLNTGFFVNKRPYTHVDGKNYVGYELCQGYVILGIPGYQRLDLCHDKNSLDETLEILGVDPYDCKNYPENYLEENPR
jgi:hypothetical protein